MAKKSLLERERKRKNLIEKYKLTRNILREKLNNTNLSLDEKMQISAKLQSLPRNSAPTRSHHRCFVTGRPRSIYRDFNLSRHVLREMAHECVLPGITKSSW